MSGVLLQSYIVLILAGVILVGAEIYVPGGVLGLIGSICLVGAVVVGFRAFPGSGGYYSAVAIVLLCGLGLLLWIFYFPRTAAGRRLTLSLDGRGGRAAGASTYDTLVGKEGEALSPLRPSGIALIGDKRYDVIAEGVWIEAGARMRVTEVHGSRIVVQPADGTGVTPGGAGDVAAP